ncbi:unnamed protein product [Sphagnum balticum]
MPMGSSSNKRKTAAGAAAGDCVGNCVVVACCCPFTILHFLALVCIKLPTKLANKAVSKHQLFKQRKRKPAAMPEVLLDAEDADDDDGDAHDTDNDDQSIANYFSSSSVWEGRRLVEEVDGRDIGLHDTATLHTENHEQVTQFQHFHSVTSESGFHTLSMLKDY